MLHKQAEQTGNRSRDDMGVSDHLSRCAMRAALTVALLIVALGCVSCANSVQVPPRDQDQAPVISLAAFTQGSNFGCVAREIVTSASGRTATVAVSAGAAPALFPSAYNPGGVQALIVTITEAGNTLYSGQITGTPDAQHLVPDTLFYVSAGTLPTATVSQAVVVHATASNFNSESTSFDVTYNPTPPINAIFTGPSQPILAGTQTTLMWSAPGATGVYISAKPPDPSISSGLLTGSSTAASPNVTTTYTLTPIDASGCGGPPQTATVTVIPPISINQFQFQPATITITQPTTLFWNVSPSSATMTISPQVGSAPPKASGSVSVAPTSTGPIVYTLTASDPLQQNVTKTATVRVNPLPAINVELSFIFDPCADGCDGNWHTEKITLSGTCGSSCQAQAAGESSFPPDYSVSWQFQEVTNGGKVFGPVGALRPGAWSVVAVGGGSDGVGTGAVNCSPVVLDPMVCPAGQVPFAWVLIDLTQPFGRQCSLSSPKCSATGKPPPMGAAPKGTRR